jgi:hypothetical protein
MPVLFACQAVIKAVIEAVLVASENKTGSVTVLPRHGGFSFSVVKTALTGYAKLSRS